MSDTDIALRPDMAPAATTAAAAQSNLRDWALSLADAGTLAKAITATDFVPMTFKGKVGDAAVAIMKGAALGLDPIASLESIYIIKGKPALYARTMAAVVLAAGHELWTEATSDDAVTVCGRRAGSDHVESATWTMQRAQMAGYTSNPKYKSNPAEMLYSKAVGEVARRVAPDVLLGLSYSAEEIELEDMEPVKIQRRRPKVEPVNVEVSPMPEPEDGGDAA